MIRLGTTLGLALLALSASAAPADDYATQWSLTLADPDAGAYAVVLDAAVYRQARSPRCATSTCSMPPARRYRRS